jgi:hypothetical protein
MNHLIKALFYLFLVLMLAYCGKKSEANEEQILIKGGLIIHTGWNSAAEDDIENGFILIEKGKIQRIGTYSDTISFPKKIQIIDASGKYIVPGLIDGFAVINNQAYANAFLLSGVTSIIGVESVRRGELYESGTPSPEIFKLGQAGDTIQSKNQIAGEFEESARHNIKIMLLMYKLTPDLLNYSLDLTRKYQMGSIGELGMTSYRQAAESGVQAFVHATRYSLDIAPEEMARAVAMEPFSDLLTSPKWKYYQYLSSLNVNDTAVLRNAVNLGSADSYLMPTLSLLYLDLPGHKNPWKEAVADLINADDINNPADRISGNHIYNEEEQAAYTKLALKAIELEQQYFLNGAKYLAGSACDVWGTMPGISLHTELELLQKVGLNNRQLLASTSSNFHEAFGWKKGKLAEGFDADILILDENPLENIENLKKIYLLLLKGEVIDLNSLKN